MYYSKDLCSDDKKPGRGVIHSFTSSDQQTKSIIHNLMSRGLNFLGLRNLAIYIGSLSMLSGNNSTSALGRKHAASDTPLGKQKRDIFKLDALCLWVEAVHHGDENGVEDGEDNERLPADICCRGC